MVLSYVLVGLCAILFAIVTYDLIKLFIKKRDRNEKDEEELPDTLSET